VAFIAVITLAEAKQYLRLQPPTLPTPTDEDALVFSLCEAVAEEIRGILNRAADADFAAVAGNQKVRHVALEMVQWYFQQTKSGGDRQGIVSLADTMQGANATTSYEAAQPMGDRWRRELRQFRIFPL
jgi:hypothetical protein